MVGEEEWHPGEPCCLVYELASNVEDLVNGELINCLFSPSFPIDGAAFEHLRGGARRQNRARGVALRASEQCRAQRVCTCARVCTDVHVAYCK